MNNYLEQQFESTDGIVVKYRHKPSKYDFQHIIFVFSGFLNSQPGNYDFANALSDCPCDVFWIGDDFESMYTYYLCINMDFKIENAVTEFIRFKINELGVSEDRVTVTGFSKGGSAALYYGLKLGMKNIVSTVPQFRIGSYVDKYWKHVAEHMMGRSYNSANIHYLDHLIVKLLRSDTQLNRNIYLLTSEADKQYPTEIAPYLADFSKYTNFNLLKTYSVFVREHNQVTGHHVALLLSIYYALASEASPRYNQGEVTFFGKPLLADPVPSGEAFIDLRTAKIVGDRLFIDGVALLRGYDVADYPDIDYYLHLKNNKSDLLLDLAKAHRPGLTKEFFNGKFFTVYDKAWFTTYQHSGVDISNIPEGKYQLHLETKLKSGISRVNILEDERKITQRERCGRYQLLVESGLLYLDIL